MIQSLWDCPQWNGRIRIVFVEVEKLQHLFGIVIAGFDAMRRLHPCRLRFGNQQHGIFGNFIFSRHTRIK
jgi:hypothetical protein